MKVNITYSLAEQTMVKLMHIGDQLWRISDERFSQWGLSDNHYNVLRILNGSETALPQTEIGRRLVSSRANVTKLIDLLEKKQFVERLSCTDRRVKQIALTKQGTQFIRDTQKQVIEFAENNMKNFSKSELEILSNLLDKLKVI